MVGLGSLTSLSREQLLELVRSNPVPVAALTLAAAVLLPLLATYLMGGGASKGSRKGKAFLDPAEYKPLPLTVKEFISHNTVRLRFDLPDPQQRLGLPIGQHISFSAKGADGKDVIRSYTPVSDDDLLGAVEFVIKIYPTGKMSQVINALQVGQTMLMRGPKGRLEYKINMKKHLGMIAGGTGITPMYQVLNAILKNKADKTKVSLVYGNLTAEDILLRKELDELQAKHPDQLKVYHVLNTPPATGWSMGSGFITADIIKQQLPAPGPDAMVLQCGPGPMIKAMEGHLLTLGYPQEMQFCF